jgi:hypothetical protein
MYNTGVRELGAVRPYSNTLSDHGFYSGPFWDTIWWGRCSHGKIHIYNIWARKFRWDHPQIKH